MMKQQPKTKLKCLVVGAAAAGKTSIIRRYLCRTFEEGIRVPTLGSDFYTGYIAHPPSTTTKTPLEEKGPPPIGEGGRSHQQLLRSEGNGQLPPPKSIHLQIWDTPGRERISLQQGQRKSRYSASLRDSFFSRADAIMLVYDMTSSNSFTQLLKWYADLLEIYKWCRDTTLPILVVANKLDIYLAENHQRTARHHPRRVAQRDVLGLRNNFRGKDLKYEYRVNHVSRARDNNNTSQSSLRISSRKRMEISSFLPTRANWTTDGSYLESLINSEDLSHPDRDMVTLWCMRNGLKHVEVSAATGEGVDEAMNVLVQIAVEAKKANSAKQPVANVPPPPTRYRRNSELDLEERYAPKDENCFFFLSRPLRVWRKQVNGMNTE